MGRDIAQIDIVGFRLFMGFADSKKNLEKTLAFSFKSNHLADTLLLMSIYKSYFLV